MEKLEPQTVVGKTLKYTENAQGQAACIREAESLLLEAVGEEFIQKAMKSAVTGDVFFLQICARS